MHTYLILHVNWALSVHGTGLKSML